MEDVSPKGIRRLTFSQDSWDQHKDYIELDDSGKVIGMYANYFDGSIIPDSILPDPDSLDEDFFPIAELTSTVTCSGKNQIKIGGSMKTLTVRFTDGYGDPVEYHSGKWSFTIDGEPTPDDLISITDVAENKIKVKFHGGDEYIGKILVATFTSGDVISSLNIEIIAL